MTLPAAVCTYRHAFGPRCGRSEADPIHVGPTDRMAWNRHVFQTERERVSSECVQCGAVVRQGQLGKVWPTGAISCSDCYDADFGGGE